MNHDVGGTCNITYKLTFFFYELLESVSFNNCFELTECICEHISTTAEHLLTTQHFPYYKLIHYMKVFKFSFIYVKEHMKLSSHDSFSSVRSY
jgi:hypothetical protein